MVANFFNNRSKAPVLDDLTRNMESLQFPTDSYKPAAPTSSPDRFTFESTTPLNKENRPLGAASPSRLNKPLNTLANPLIAKRDSKVTAKQLRMVNVTQMYFLDFYCDYFDYVITRRERTRNVLNNLHGTQNRELEWKSYANNESSILRKRRLRPKNKDFEIITQIGQGGYGEVYLSRKKDTKEICALKVISKSMIVKMNETEHLLTEREILATSRSDWLVKLLYSFQDNTNVYLGMEFVPGGDFRTLLGNCRTLSPVHTRFYLAEMFAALNDLHRTGYIHRDLKPENFLIDSKGHLKLTDFGLASGTIADERINSMKIRLERIGNAVTNIPAPSRTVQERRKIYQQLRGSDLNYSKSVVGSPDYMAIDIVKGYTYDKTVDYWSIGCILFECLVGFTPFSGETNDEIYTNLKNYKTYFVRPKNQDNTPVFSDRTWDLLSRLITDNQSRLRNFEQIRRTNYFSGIDFDNLKNKAPPFIPSLDSDLDAGYFDDFENEEHMSKYTNVFKNQKNIEKLANQNNSVKNPNFVGFTFKHKGQLNQFRSLFENKQRDPFSTLY